MGFWDMLSSGGAASGGGQQYGFGNFVNDMVKLQNPIVADTNLPTWAKLLATTKVGYSGPGGSFSIGSQGGGNDLRMYELMKSLRRGGGGATQGAGPSVIQGPSVKPVPATDAASFAPSAMRIGYQSMLPY